MKLLNVYQFLFAIIITGAMSLYMDVPLADSHSQSAEATQTRIAIFTIHDSNKDGYLSKTEYDEFVTQRDYKRRKSGRPMRRFSIPLEFNEIDSNHDQLINEEEMIDALNKRLRKHRRYRQQGGQR